MTEEQLIQGCKRSDRDARSELFKTYAPKMLGICLRLVKDRMAAEDLVHDGFVIVFTKIDDFRNHGSFEGWLRRIFVNISLNHLKASKRTEILDDSNWEIMPFEPVDADALKKIGLDELIGTINKLPDDLRTVLSLFSIEGYSHEEISKMLGITKRSSETRLYKAKRMLAKFIENEGRN